MVCESADCGESFVVGNADQERKQLIKEIRTIHFMALTTRPRQTPGDYRPPTKTFWVVQISLPRTPYG